MQEDLDQAKGGQTLTILMLPWLAHDHLAPFLELAERLSRKNILVHFVSTPANLASLAHKINRKAFPSVALTPLHLPFLPPQLHTTNHLPAHLLPALKTAFDLSRPAFSSLLQELRPDLLVFDFAHPWAARAAQDLCIPSVLFLTTGAAATAFFCHCLKNRDGPFPYMDLSPEEEHANYEEMLRKTANGITETDSLTESIELSANFVAVKSFTELEGKYIEYLSRVIGKEVVPVGPLVPDALDEDHESSRKVTEWLDGRERNSVLFVSLGSCMEDEEVEEIARGLEMSGVGFVWALRYQEEEEEERPVQGANEHLFGFMERVGEDKGLLLEGCPPQREILSHMSIGGFLTHCSWSAVMEGMMFGVPMVALPMELDQPLNARLVSEAGIGVEIRRELVGDGGGAGFRRFRREEIAEAIREVMVGDRGWEVRKKMKGMAEMLGFKGNEEVSHLVGKIALLCTGGKEEGRGVKSLGLVG